MTVSKIILGTRRSQLALWQANHVKKLIEENLSIPVRLKKITTSGDRLLDRPLHDLGGKGLFLKEIEAALADGSIDIAVHSMKDIPYEIAEEFSIPAIIKRDDPYDCLVSNKYASYEAMPPGAVIGTSSLRRIFQLKKRNPGLQFNLLRGNIDSRLRKLDEGCFDAVVLATCGLKRLGYEARITQTLDIVPAVGQGAIGIECLNRNQELCALMGKLRDDETARNVNLERYFSLKVGGTCEIPMGCLVVARDPSRFKMRCFHARPDGSGYFEREISGRWEAGKQLVDHLINRNRAFLSTCSR